jgi:glutamine synthetase
MAMELTDELLGMKAAEAETELKASMVKEYSNLSIEELQFEMDSVERQMPEDYKNAREMEIREKTLRGILESAIWRGYLSLSQAELQEELADKRSDVEDAFIAGPESAVEALHLGRIEAVLTEMVESWN